jgi:hypothetical protein
MNAAYSAPAPFGLRYASYVEPKPSNRLHVPSDGGHSSTSQRPGSADLPRVDERLVRPETREELVRGRLVIAAPANEPHARSQAGVVSVAQLTATEGFFCATEMLTHAGPGSDFATDACICREGTDPATGGRYIEEVAFEVVAEQSFHEITERAQDLVSRGVRRVIAVFVKRNEVCEWSSERNSWLVLDPDGQLEDPTFVRPIPVRALLDRAAADDTVAWALHAKRNRVIVDIEAKSLEKGLALARKAIEGICGLLEIPLDPERRAVIQALDAERLEALHDRILAERRWP